jgi:murein DD-endopeptidase MepM/ murein hydrolase activator NlpD
MTEKSELSKNLKPFLYLPFEKQKYKITEGWNYSDQEKSIHGIVGHGGIDFAIPKGTPVLAPADGIAISSYFSYPLLKNGKSVKYNQKQVFYGLGFFVQIYHPDHSFYTSYGHLEKISPEIKFHYPRKLGNNFWPVGNKISPEKLVNYPFATKVKKGQVIGYVGNSGLGLGNIGYPDYKNYKSWDEVHLHFEIFMRYGSKKRKKYFDPYGIKEKFDKYTDSNRKGFKLGQKGFNFWILNNQGKPSFIK